LWQNAYRRRRYIRCDRQPRTLGIPSSSVSPEQSKMNTEDAVDYGENRPSFEFHRACADRADGRTDRLEANRSDQKRADRVSMVRSAGAHGQSRRGTNANW